VGLNGTYIAKWKMQPDGLTYESAVGRNAPSVPGPFERWKHYAALNWRYGAWGATLAQTWQSGYEDTNEFSPNVANPPAPRRVSSYGVWDLQGRYSGFRNTTIALGVKNLFDRDPPFTNQPFTYQVGYDPSYADPRGRTFYASLTYAFK
jgi:iron complex outermembrane receptor protein